MQCTTSPGLASWDSVGTQIDIESELRNIATQCPNGEEVRNGTWFFFYFLHSDCWRKYASGAITAQSDQTEMAAPLSSRADFADS